MKARFLSLLLAAFFAVPLLLADSAEVEIQLFEVVNAGLIGGDAPLGDPSGHGSTPTNPTDFRAVRNGNTLSITRQNEDIPFAQAIVVRAANGSIVLNQQFTESLSEQIATSGVYVLRIETDGGALVGQFMVP